jgi:hypothetical protein
MKGTPLIQPVAFKDSNGCGDVYDTKHSVQIVSTKICNDKGKKDAGEIYNQKLKDIASGNYKPLNQQLEESVTTWKKDIEKKVKDQEGPAKNSTKEGKAKAKGEAAKAIEEDS